MSHPMPGQRRSITAASGVLLLLAALTHSACDTLWPVPHGAAPVDGGSMDADATAQPDKATAKDRGRDLCSSRDCRTCPDMPRPLDMTPDLSAKCGNGIVDTPHERCDRSFTKTGAVLMKFASKKTCRGYGYQGGVLGCTAGCELDFSGCHNCGNGKLDPGEECDITYRYFDGGMASSADAGRVNIYKTPLRCSFFNCTSGRALCINCRINLSGCSGCAPPPKPDSGPSKPDARRKTDS